jgi:hypothetical protein
VRVMQWYPRYKGYDEYTRYKPRKRSRRHGLWYETDTGHEASRAYSTRAAAEKERPLALTWGWESGSARLLRMDHDRIEYRVLYQRAPDVAGAAAVKRSWEAGVEAAIQVAQAHKAVARALVRLRAALMTARTSATNPIRLEQRVRDATRALIAASATLLAHRHRAISHLAAARDAHDALQTDTPDTICTPIMRDMDLPTRAAIEEALAVHTTQDRRDADAARALPPALPAQERVVAAVIAWQAAVRTRWRAQRAYLPVEGRWQTTLARLRTRLRRAPRPTPDIALSRQAVLTQVLHSTEVAPADAAWRDAEEHVTATEVHLIESLATRDQAMTAVAIAFSVTL